VDDSYIWLCVRAGSRLVMHHSVSTEAVSHCATCRCVFAIAVVHMWYAVPRPFCVYGLVCFACVHGEDMLCWTSVRTLRVWLTPFGCLCLHVNCGQHVYLHGINSCPHLCICLCVCLCVCVGVAVCVCRPTKAAAAGGDSAWDVALIAGAASGTGCQSGLMAVACWAAGCRGVRGREGGLGRGGRHIRMER
jgi:hypothetical protein